MRVVEGLLGRTFDGAYQEMRSMAVAGKEIKPHKINATKLKKLANSRPKTLARGHILTWLVAQPGMNAQLKPWIKKYLATHPGVRVFMK